MSIEANLQERILELEAALREVRDIAESFLADPGNEDDGLNDISSTATSVLHDGATYKFDLEKYYGE